MSAISGTASVHLELDSRPESVTLVRTALAGTAEQLGLGGERLDDVRTAVSEACNNVVLHAYGGDPGPLWIDFELEPDVVRVRVLDRGSGIRSIISPQNRMRVGLALISALSDRAEVLTPVGGGTEVRMVFAGGDPAAAPAHGRASAPLPDLRPLSGDVVAFISPVGLLAGVLGRVCATVAAQAHFSVDRHADLDLVADEVGALARSAARGDGIGFALTVRARHLELRVGPFAAGSCKQLRAPAPAPGAEDPAPLRLLADRLFVETLDGADTLRLQLADRHRRFGSARVRLRR